MKLSASLLVLVWLTGLAFCPMAEAQLAVGNIRPAQRANSKLVDIDYDITGTNVPVSVSLQGSADGGATWTLPVNTLTGAVGTSVTPGNNLRITWNAGVDWNQQVSARTKFRITVSAPLAGFAFIPTGEFAMGDALDGLADAPAHSVNVSAFYLAKSLATKREWDTVRAWALVNGYTDLAGGEGKGTNHPVQTVSWFDAVKFCNARSEQEGLTACYQVGGTVMRSGTTEPTVNWTANGYRLPTEAEWEKAARGGLSGKRFPWGNTITHSQANYYSEASYSYDLSSTAGYHPTYAVEGYPYTSPMGSFAPNGYGLNDMAGNVWQWSWDWYGTYGTGAPTDPRGSSSGSYRVLRGGSWYNNAHFCRVAYRGVSPPYNADYGFGFRVARSSVPSFSLVTAESPEITVDTRDDVQLTVSALHGSVTGGGLYRPGSTVSLGATPAPGYVFSSWSGGASGTANPLSIVVNADTSVTANFLIPAGSPLVSLDGQLATGDNVSKINSTTVTMTSTHVVGLIYYTLDGTAPGFNSALYGGPFTLTNSAVVRALGLDVDTFGTVEAPPTTVTIIPVAYPVAAGSAGGGSASVAPVQASYLSNSIVTITATASNGWSFLNWAGDASGTSNPLSYPVNAPSTNVQAVFGTVVQANRIGHGTVQFDQANPVAYGTTVQATATPSNGWYFVQWSGAVTGTNNPASFTVTSTDQVEAVFAQILYSVGTTVLGGGTIELYPANPVLYGTVVRATAVPSSGSYFVSWGGALAGTNNPSSFPVINSNVVRAIFTALPVSSAALTVRLSGEGEVTVVPRKAYYTLGDTVTLTATPRDDTNQFLGWSGDVTGTANETVLTMNSSKVVTASFASGLPILHVTLTGALNARQVTLSFVGLPWQNYILESSTNLEPGQWTSVVTNRAAANGAWSFTDTALNAAQKFYRVTLGPEIPNPTVFALIPAGEFSMGDALDGLSDAPVHAVNVSEFYMAKNLTTKAEWDVVRTWALSHGYPDLAVGEGKGTNHPVQTVTWFDVVKWCNARSEQKGLTPCYQVGGAVMRTGTTAPTVNWMANGYRLPTEAEWEKAARGGLSGKRFPWGDTISHSQANYYSDASYSYDVSPTRGYHPTYAVGARPYTSPVGSFATNGYGLNDMAGNVWQWCWDWYGTYDTGTPTDPRGPTYASSRVFRGGFWATTQFRCRSADRSSAYPDFRNNYVGFRVARSSVP